MMMGFRDYEREGAVAADPVAADVERLYRDRLPELRRVAASVSGSRDAAADLVQEAFVRALRSTAQFRSRGTLDGWVEANKTYAFFVPVVRSARNHPKIFGALITLGELSIGLSMLLGLLTRLFAFLGVFMLFSFAFGAGQGLAPPGNALLMGAIFVVFVLAPPGRVLGVDAVWRARFPRWMV